MRKIAISLIILVATAIVTGLVVWVISLLDLTVENKALLVTLSVFTLFIFALSWVLGVGLKTSEGFDLCKSCKMIAILSFVVALIIYINHCLGYPMPLVSRSSIGKSFIYDSKEYLGMMRVLLKVSCVFLSLAGFLWLPQLKK